MIASIGGRPTYQIVALSPLLLFLFLKRGFRVLGINWEFCPPTSINLSVLFGINSLLEIKFRRQSGNGNSIQFNSGASESND